MMHILGVRVLGQVSMPTAQAPGEDDFVGSIMGPIGPWLSTAWWYAETFFIPFCIVAGLVGICLAAVVGHRRMMVRMRGVLWTVAAAVFSAGVVMAFVNWAIKSYGLA